MSPTSERILLGPGPSVMSPRVMKALSAPMLSHLDPQFVAIMDDVRARLGRVFQAPEGSLAFAVSGTGTSAMETAIANLVGPGTRVLSVVSGYFADRLAQMAARYGGSVTRVEAEWGRAIDPEQVRQALKASGAELDVAGIGRMGTSVSRTGRSAGGRPGNGPELAGTGVAQDGGMSKARCLFLAVLVCLISALSAACATNPVTGKKQMTLLSEAEELAIGQQQDLEIRREMGVYDDPELQRYVNDIGQELARRSHRPNLPWSFTIVDSPAINAFALPGGYIYLTRGIMAYLDDESELAGVLGHEIGHVTARHAAQAYTRQAQANLGMTILSIFVPGTRPFANLGVSGLGVLFLRHGREAELEADSLGVQYGSGAGYDPGGVPRFLSTLARISAMSERGVPNWLSTHPNPGVRVAKAEPLAGKFASADARTVNQDQYLERISGLTFGDNPKDGIVRGSEFLQPLLRIGVKFPDGWELTNTPDAVMAQEPGTQHFMVLQEVEASAQQGYAARGARTLADVAVTAMRTSGFTAIDGTLQQINGNDAYIGRYRGKAKDVGDVEMRAAHIQIGRQLYVVAGFAPKAAFERIDPAFRSSLQTFRQLTVQEASNIRPNKIDFYVVRRGDSWQSIAARQSKGYVNAATLAIMNDREVNVQPQAGDRIKIVVEG
ncbi:MAG: aminotransferase class V-fold PLP-dependent enzyme [Cyanobacteria bacterium]|nr:aminotransferase class V-fold PLP-dependent enzyme [Cyanobacteriota bacterium]